MNKILEELYKSPAYKSLSPSYQAELQFFLLSALTEQINDLKKEIEEYAKQNPYIEYAFAISQMLALLDKKLQ